MGKDGKTGKNEILPVILMGCMFVIVYALVLFLTDPFIEDAGVTPAFEDINNPLNIVYIIAIMLVVTLVILLIAKYWKEKLIQFIILGAVGYTTFFAFFLPIFTIIFPDIIFEVIIFFSVIASILLIFTPQY